MVNRSNLAVGYQFESGFLDVFYDNILSCYLCFENTITLYIFGSNSDILPKKCIECRNTSKCKKIRHSMHVKMSTQIRQTNVKISWSSSHDRNTRCLKCITNLKAKNRIIWYPNEFMNVIQIEVNILDIYQRQHLSKSPG